VTTDNARLDKQII